VLPLIDGAAPRLEPLGPLAAASEAIRHLVFGVSLGLIYPLRLARLPRQIRGAQQREGVAASPAAATS
jgi:hypothetical protein